MPESAPMIQLEEGGVAPVLSYQVPDSTSFAGRHYLEIDTPLEHFLDALPGIQVSTARPKAAPVIAPGGVREVPGVILRNLVSGSTLPLAPGNYSDSFTADVASKPTLARSLALAAGSVPRVYSVATVDTEDEDTNGSGTAETPQDRRIDAASDAGETRVTASVRVLVPTSGASFASGGAGAEVVVRARVVVSPEGENYAPRVVATLDGASAPVFSQNVTGEFTFTLPNVQSGSHAITFTYRPTKGSPAEVHTSRTFVVTATGSGSAAPVLGVEAPTAGSVVVDAAGRDGIQYGAVSIRCHATHPSGIEKVTVSTSGFAAVPLTAGTGGAFAGTADLLGYGAHSVVVTALATTGERAELAIPVTLTDKAPGSYLYSRLMLVQRVQLTTRLGDYGAGRVVKTFSMLPGERMNISVKTYRRSTLSEKRASTIFDGVEDTTADEFTKAVDSENNNKAVSEDSLQWEVKAKVEQGWGSGHASLSAGVNGGHNASLETFSKNVMSAASKHAATASAKRTMEVNAESQTQTEVGEEETITREIANINQSRTLNFVFRQMNQEFISVLHLVDVRIAYAAFYRRTDTGELQVEYREATIAQIESFLRQVLIPDAVPAVHAGILQALQQVADYRDCLTPLIERVVPTRAGPNGDIPAPELGYWRVRRDLSQTWTDPTGGKHSTVPGIVLSGDVNVMRTDGLIVDAVLGGGEALDRFSRDLQAATVAAREAEAAQSLALARRTALGTTIIADAETARADVWATITPPPVAPRDDDEPA
jgi:hypothetical protein